jgi:phosphatidylserine decarboxylase
MKLTRYGYDVIIVMAIVTVALLAVGFFVQIVALKVLLILLGLLLAAFTVYFFRDPERVLPGGSEAEGVVVSPADGKVVVVKDLVDNEYQMGPAKQISIFLSPLNVHVNRAPISGTVDYYKYIEGKYLVAFHEKSSELNERTHIGISNGRIKLLVKQIAGAVARRIVCELKVGDHVNVGDRFGMIKFGSRTDLIVPPEMVVEVKLGDIVVGGETVICRMPHD